MKKKFYRKQIWMAVWLVCAALISLYGVQAEAASKKSVTKSGITYQVTNSAKKTAAVLKAKRTIKTATIPATVKINGKTYKVTKVSKNAFKNCGKLTAVTLGSNVSAVGTSAFSGNSKLAKIVIESKKLQKVGKNAFKGIKKTAVFYAYKSKTKSYKKLLKKTSVGWKKTMKIVVDDSGEKVTKSGITYKVTSVSRKTAEVAKAKTSITSASIPATVKIKGKSYKVTAIAANAFKNCSSLKKIKIKSTKITKIGKNAFRNIQEDAVFSVPSGVWKKYKKLITDPDTGWKKTMTVKDGKGQVYTEEDTEEGTEEEPETVYTYAISALLEPINEYFYVKTDNPDPDSFRIVDETSQYSDDAVVFTQPEKTYCDVVYENKDTYRVKDGYIFYSGSTDGGALTLQEKKEVEYAVYKSADEDARDRVYDRTKGQYIYYVWTDNDNVTLKLDTLYDEIDYLIKTYAGNGTFFEKMDAVESGFSDICLYSGSYVKGQLEKIEGKYWGVSANTHVDQSFYIFSPYERTGNKYLFASSLYPFRYDSLGFPGVMASVAKRLDSSATYEWSSTLHYMISVTYGGETKSYGGQGNGEGQGITEDQIKYIFRFDGSSEDSVGAGMEQLKAMLTDYAGMDAEDDIPRDDALTWKDIADTVGETGAWVKVGGGYSYLYREGDGTNFSAEEWGVGYSIYWGGDLGYCSDTWVDGRYIGVNEVYVEGETFADHPTSNIMLINYELPYLIDYDRTYKYNSETNQYERVYSNVEIGTKTQNVKFYYDSDSGKWIASTGTRSLIETMVEQGVVDQSVLDALELTADEVAALGVDANTNTTPEHGYRYDRTVTPGTTF